MGRIGRWTKGFFARCDELANRIENHDGLVSAALREAHEARARARQRLGRVHSDGERVKQHLAKLVDAESRWKERALRVAEHDEQRALECLRRCKRAGRERCALEIQAAERERVERQLREDLARIDERIARLTRQRDVLRNRESRADALAVSWVEDGHLITEIDDLFERWDAKVSAIEIRSDCDIAADDELEAVFIENEGAEDLRAELAALVRREGAHDHGCE